MTRGALGGSGFILPGLAQCALALLVLLAAGPEASAQSAPNFAPAVITTKKIDHFAIASDAVSFGELEFRGGLELSSRYPSFGGWSGIDFDEASGRLIAVSDFGLWMTAQPVEQNGLLTGLADTRLAPMLDLKGKVIRRKALGDAESVRLLRQGGPGAIVFYEESRSLRIFRSPLDRLPATTPKEIPIPAGAHRLYGNTGIEAAAIAPPESPLAGAMVILGEHSLDADGNGQGWVLDGPLAGQFAVKRSGNYDFTDAAFLPNGDLVVLERRFGLSEGIGMRIRRIAGSAIRPGAVVDGKTVMEADLRNQIDNMEGMALRPRPNGEVMVMLISDDNRSILQRTLLLEFAWRPGETASASSAP